MQNSSLKSLHSVWLATAGLALLLLGASTPRLTAQQSDNFDDQMDSNWTHYTAPPSPGYGVAQFSFPTNTWGPAGNYAYRIYVPPITLDSNVPPLLNARGGAMWLSPSAQYGSIDSGRFSVGADMVAWNNTWSGEALGLGWYAQNANFMTTETYLSGWGPGFATLGIATIQASAGTPTYNIIGQVANNTTVLDTTHQYRFVASSPDGQTFLVQLYDRSNTNTPWQSAITVDMSYFLYMTPGYCGLLCANIYSPPPEGPNSTDGADATFDNYYAYEPSSTPPAGMPATLPACVTDVSPTPAEPATSYYPTLSVCIFNRDTDVVPGSINMYLDGVLIPNGSLTIESGSGDSSVFYAGDGHGVHKPNPSGYPTVFPGATVTYQLTNMPAQGWHTNIVVFQDDQMINGKNVWHTNAWSWMALAPSISLYATNSLPIGSLSVRGFKGRTVVSANSFDNALANAFMVLDYPATNASGMYLAATNITQLVAWDIGDHFPTLLWGAVTNYPGLCLPTTNVNYFACQVQAFLQLTNGVHRLHVDSDDGVGIYSGTDVNDTSAVLLMAASNGGSVTHSDFDFYVPADGLYPFNIIHEEGVGDAYLCLYEVDLSTISGTTNLVNSSGSKVAAFYPAPVWKPTSTSTVKTGYNPVAATLTATHPALTTINTNGDYNPGCSVMNQVPTSWSGTNTITVTPAVSPTYYRLSGGPGTSQVLSCTKSGANLAITYRWTAQ